MAEIAEEIKSNRRLLESEEKAHEKNLKEIVEKRKSLIQQMLQTFLTSGLLKGTWDLIDAYYTTGVELRMRGRVSPVLLEYLKSDLLGYSHFYLDFGDGVRAGFRLHYDKSYCVLIEPTYNINPAIFVEKAKVYGIEISLKGLEEIKRKTECSLNSIEREISQWKGKEST